MAPNHPTSPNPTKKDGRKRKNADESDASNCRSGLQNRKRSASFINATGCENVGRKDYDYSREIYVGNLALDFQNDMLEEFISCTLKFLGLVEPAAGSTVCTVASRSRRYAFLTFCSERAATAALVMDKCPFLGLELNVERPTSYRGPPIGQELGWDLVVSNCSANWRPGHLAPKHLDENSSLEMHVSDIPGRISTSELTEFLGSALEMAGLSNTSGSSGISCRIRDGEGAVQFRTPEEATNALCLNGIPCMGSHLKISRPDRWQGPSDGKFLCWRDFIARMGAQPLLSLIRRKIARGGVREILCISDMNTEVPGMADLLKEFLQNTLACVGSQKLTRTGSKLIRDCDIEDNGIDGLSAIATFSSTQAATEALILDKVPFMGTRLSLKRPNSYIGPKDPAIDWKFLQDNRRRGVIFNSASFASSPKENEISRELVLENVPTKATNKILKLFLRSALEQIGMSEAPGSPITKFSFEKDGLIKVQFRTSKEATNALWLNRIPFMDKNIIVSRPRNWTGPISTHDTNWNTALSTFRMSSGASIPDTSSNSSNPRLLGIPRARTSHKAVVILDDELMEETAQEVIHIEDDDHVNKPESVFGSKKPGSDATRGEQTLATIGVEKQLQELKAKFEKEQIEAKDRTTEMEKQHHELETVKAECSATKKKLETLSNKNADTERKFDELIEQHSTVMADLARERKSRRKAEERAESLIKSISELKLGLELEIKKRNLAEEEVSRLKAQLARSANPLHDVKVKQEDQGEF